MGIIKIISVGKIFPEDRADGGIIMLLFALQLSVAKPL